MQNFQDLIRQASHLKQFQLKKDRTHYQSLPNFLKNSLSYSKKYSHLRSQHFFVRMFASDNIKRLGNDAVKENKFEEALAKYQESLSIFRYIQTRTQQNIKDSDLTYHLYSPNPQQQQERKKEEEIYNKHVVSLYLNISLCLTKLNKKQESILSVKEAMKIDESNPKCYYRIGQSYIKYINRTDEDVKEGVRWLERAYDLGRDEGVRKEIEKVRKEAERENVKEQKMFSMILNQSNNLRESTISQKDQSRIEIPKKERSNSTGKKPSRKGKHQSPPEQKQRERQTKPSEQNISSEHNKNLLISKQLDRIKTNEFEKKIKTEQKLVKISYKQNWEIHLLQNFILTKGHKILSIIELCGTNYKEYQTEFRTILNKCSILYQKTSKKEEKFVDNDGEEVTLNFDDKDTKEVVNQQKLKIYNLCVDWLRRHPMEPIKKYTQRYDAHRRFIQEKIEERKKKSQSVSKAFDSKREENRRRNLKWFYVAIAVIIFWISYSHLM